MSYQGRKTAIERLEVVRGSRVLTYVLSDKTTFPPGIPGFNVQIDAETQWAFRDQMRSMGHVPAIDLLLYTRGGATDAVWPLVTLLREHCDRLSVLVPFRAHSGGTLICLGADEVVLLDTGELSPIDPTTGNQFNPVDPANSAARLGISVEDVTSYFELARTRAGLTDPTLLADVFKALSNSVHPLALGNVQRVYMQIRRLAGRLLALHMDEESQAKDVERITKALTEQFYSHVHAITRREACDLLGPWVRRATDEETEAIEGVFDVYVTDLHLRDKYMLPEVMGDEPIRNETVVGGYVESRALAHAHITHLRILQRPQLPANVQVQVPPGATIPLQQWPQRMFDFGLQRSGWVVNTEGI